FAAALLNSQPMGFYAPAQLVRDAREHGVEVRPPDVNASDWDCTLEPIIPPPSYGGGAPSYGAEGEGHTEDFGKAHESFARLSPSGPAGHLPRKMGEVRRRCALRLGLRQVAGLNEDDIKRLVERRTEPYRDPGDLWRRSGLNKRQIVALA